MNWEAIGAVGEIVGAAAVVISLVYLAQQTRSNASALRANALWNAEIAFGQINYAHGHDPAMSVLMSRAYAPGAKASDFSETELSQLHFVVRGAIQNLQAQWYLWKEGSLPDDVWDRRRYFARSFIELPLIHSIWQSELEQHVIADEFRAAVESETAQGNLQIGGVPG